MADMLPALCVGLLSSAGAEAEAEACGSSWLQQDYSLSSRMATEVQVVEAASVHQAGPLTDELNERGFSDLVVPISPVVIMMLVLFVALLIAHEAFVAAGMKPVLANHQKSNSIPLQWTFALSWLLMMVSLAMLVPVSLDYSLAMGQSATASGLFLSGPTVFAVFGTILGRPLTSEVNWDQRFARSLYIQCQGLVFLGCITLAFLMQEAANWSDSSRRTAFWAFLFVHAVLQFFQALPMVALSTMWNVVTPNNQKTLWSMITACRVAAYR